VNERNAEVVDPYGLSANRLYHQATVTDGIFRVVSLVETLPEVFVG